MEALPSMLFIDCPGCQKPLKVREELAGKKVKCPDCGQTVPVPADQGADEPRPVEVVAGAPAAVTPTVPAADVIVMAKDTVEVSGTGDVPREAAPTTPARAADGDSLVHQPAPYPAVVTAVGMIWILHSVMNFLMTFAALGLVLLSLGGTRRAWGDPGEGSFVTLGLWFCFSTIFLHIGVHTVRGTASGTLAYGIGSILLSMAYLSWSNIFFVGISHAVVGGGNLNILAEMIGAAFNAWACGLLLLAGLLALVGNGKYQAWRKAEQARMAAVAARQEERDVNR
jgi:hypothetical protein